MCTIFPFLWDALFPWNASTVHVRKEFKSRKTHSSDFLANKEKLKTFPPRILFILVGLEDKCRQNIILYNKYRTQIIWFVFIARRPASCFFSRSSYPPPPFLTWLIGYEWIIFWRITCIDFVNIYLDFVGRLQRTDVSE